MDAREDIEQCAVWPLVTGAFREPKGGGGSKVESQRERSKSQEAEVDVGGDV